MAEMITTVTGKNVNPLVLTEDDIDIRDIAHGLALLCRFNGHCSEFYSVTQHSVWVSKVCSPEKALFGLLHDAAEAYLGDIQTPVKRQLQKFEKAEECADAVIYKGLRLTAPTKSEHDKVKEVDKRALEYEMRHLFPGVDGERSPNFKAETWRRAKQSFLERYEELTGTKVD